MDGVGAEYFGGRDNGRHVQIAVCGGGRADAEVLVREANVQRVLVGLRIDRDRLDAEFPARIDDAKGDLTTVRDQNLFEHFLACAGAPPSAPLPLRRPNREQSLAVLNRLAVLRVDIDDLPLVLGVALS